MRAEPPLTSGHGAGGGGPEARVEAAEAAGAQQTLGRLQPGLERVQREQRHVHGEPRRAAGLPHTAKCSAHSTPNGS